MNYIHRPKVFCLIGIDFIHVRCTWQKYAPSRCGKWGEPVSVVTGCWVCRSFPQKIQNSGGHSTLQSHTHTHWRACASELEFLPQLSPSSPPTWPLGGHSLAASSSRSHTHARPLEIRISLSVDLPVVCGVCCLLRNSRSQSKMAELKVVRVGRRRCMCLVKLFLSLISFHKCIKTTLLPYRSIKTLCLLVIAVITEASR